MLLVPIGTSVEWPEYALWRNKEKKKNNILFEKSTSSGANDFIMPPALIRGLDGILLWTLDILISL